VKRHFSLLYLLYNFLQLVKLVTKISVSVFVEIQFGFSFIHMIGKPPIDRLNLTVPWILRVVAVAIVAGLLENSFHIVRNGMNIADVVWLRSFRNVARRVNELYDDECRQEYKQNFLNHGGSFLFLNEDFACHFFWNGNSHHGKDGWRHIAEFTGTYLSFPFFVDDEERDRVQCVRSI